QEERLLDHQASRDEVLKGVVGRLLLQCRRDRQRVDRSEQHLVAVRRAARDPQRSSHAGGAADVFDDELLTKRLRHADCKDARRRIGRAARCKRNDHGDGPGRPALRRGLSGRSGDCKCAEHQQRKSKPISHVLLLNSHVLLLKQRVEVNSERGSRIWSRYSQDARLRRRLIDRLSVACLTKFRTKWRTTAMLLPPSRRGIEQRSSLHHMSPEDNSEVTNDASDFRLGGQSGLSASVARTAALDPDRTFLRKSNCQLIASTMANMGR